MSSSPSPDTGPRDVLISMNPIAGARSPRLEVDRLSTLLEVEDFQPQVLTDLAQVGQLANQYHKQGSLRAVVAVGGDGTVAEIVNRTAPGVPITILPTGNENLLARYLHLARSPEALAETITHGRLVRLDAGRAGERWFLLMISCGFDAEVVRRFQLSRKGHVGYRSYVLPILRTVAHYDYPRMVIYCSESSDPQAAAERQIEAPWLFAFNLPCYGGGLRFTPQASAEDGLLDVCTFDRGSLYHGLRYVTAIIRQRHERLKDCQIFRSAKLRIEAEGKVPYQLDGDFAGYLPVEVEVVPERLAFLVPRECDIGLANA